MQKFRAIIECLLVQAAYRSEIEGRWRACADLVERGAHRHCKNVKEAHSNGHPIQKLGQLKITGLI